MPISSMIRYISLHEILDNVLAHPLLKDVSFERAVNHAVHFMRIVGCPPIFTEETAVVDIEDYRGVLPCNLESIIQVRTTGECGHHHGIFRYTTDSFHMSDHKHPSHDLTYKVQGNVIYTSIKEGKIEIAYRSFAVDSEGYPLIPDDSSFIRALELYIKKYQFTILFDTGKITPQVFNQVLQDYSWAVAQAQTSLIKPSIDEMQAITASLNTLLPRIHDHSQGFINLGTQEKIRSH